MCRSLYAFERRMRLLPEVQAVLGASEQRRSECAVACVVAAIEPRGPQWTREQAATVLARMLGRRRLALAPDQVEAILEGICQARSAYTAAGLLGGLARSIEAAAPEWTQYDRDRLAGLIAAATAVAGDHSLALRLRRLVAGSDWDGAPLSVLEAGDDFASGFLAVLEASGEDPVAVAGLIELLASYPKRGAPSASWRLAATQSWAGLDDASGLSAQLLDMLNRANPVRGRLFLREANERVACAVARWVGVNRDRRQLGRLRRLAEKSAGWHMRLANACVDAISEIATMRSARELARLASLVGWGAEDGLLRRHARTRLDQLAASKAITLDELLAQANVSPALQPARPRPPATRISRREQWRLLGESFAASMTSAQAEAVRHLRVDQQRRWKSVAIGFYHLYPGQLYEERLRIHPIVGRLLGKAAAQLLNEDPDDEPWGGRL